MKTIKGITVELPDNRSVFVGDAEDDDDVYIQFRNHNTIHRFKLSKEAGFALFNLLQGTADGEPTIFNIDTYEVPMVWQVVRDLDA